MLFKWRKVLLVEVRVRSLEAETILTFAVVETVGVR